MADGSGSKSQPMAPEEFHRRHDVVQTQLGEETTYDPDGPVPAWANLPEQPSAVLEELGRRHGGAASLVVHRPGSWEAQHVLRLAAGADD